MSSPVRPTNHLDAAAVAWLVAYLREGHGGVACSVVVSHDSAFLDKVCTDIVHFDDCRLKYYTGRVEGLTSTRKAVVELRAVCFRYPSAKDCTIRNVHAKVTLDSRVAIIGPNGSGKSTLMALLCGEIRPTPDERGELGEVNRHRSLRLAYIAQDHAFHLGDFMGCTPVQYVQLRFRNGYDEELQRRLNSPADANEDNALRLLAARYGKYGKRVEAVISRCRRKGEWRYEVQWQDLCNKQNTFESVAKLRQLGVERMATALDERLAAVQLGNNERPLTSREIVHHFESFGLSEELVARCTVASLSAGQKSKLSLGAAFWMRPHLVCLDEPTNFLDFDAVSTLERALRVFRGAAVVISHNEDFLAAVCNEIWSVQDGEMSVVRAADVQSTNSSEEEEEAQEMSKGGKGATNSRAQEQHIPEP